MGVFVISFNTNVTGKTMNSLINVDHHLFMVFEYSKKIFFLTTLPEKIRIIQNKHC